MERGRRALTSERVFKSVKGMRMKPTPVRAVLPTIRSPAVDNLTFPPGDTGPAPFTLKYPDSPKAVRNRDSERK